MADLYCRKGYDYRPCRCSPGEVFCEDISPDEIAKTFWKNPVLKRYDIDPPFLNDVFLTVSKPPLSDGHVLNIPANLLGNHIISNCIEFTCWSYYPDPESSNSNENIRQLNFDADAFSSSRTSLKKFHFIQCNLEQLDFSFLAGFDRLQELKIFKSLNVDKARWDLFPNLPSLQDLLIDGYRDEIIINDLSENWAMSLKPFPSGLAVQKLLFSEPYYNVIVHVQWFGNYSFSDNTTAEMIKNPFWKSVGFNMFLHGSIEQITINCKNFEFEVIENENFLGNVLSKIEIDGCGVCQIEPGAFNGKYIK